MPIAKGQIAAMGMTSAYTMYQLVLKLVRPDVHILTLLAFARARGETEGHVLAFFVIAIAAAEAAVGLAMVLAMFRLKQDVHVDTLKLLKR